MSIPQWEPEENTGKRCGKVHKKTAKNLCKLFISPLARGEKICYTAVRIKKKGGMAMLHLQTVTLEDVDDLIFSDSKWNHSER